MGTTPRTSTPYPDLTDPPDGPGQFLAALGSLEKYAIPVYVDAADRNSTVGTPGTGERPYAHLADTNRLTRWDGSAWEILDASGTWTPTLTNIAVGTGGSAALTGKWAYSPGMLAVSIVAVLGSSGASVSGTPTFSLPDGFAPDDAGTSSPGGVTVALVAAGSFRVGTAIVSSSPSVQVFAQSVSGSYIARAGISSSVPATWAAGDSIRIQGAIPGEFT